MDSPPKPLTGSSNSVFQPKQKRDYRVDYESVFQTIPDGSHTEPQNSPDQVEMRWRFLHIPISTGTPERIKRVIEISKLVPGQPRVYMNRALEWIPYEVDPFYDQFVVKQYFHYSRT